jgi:hypothetical protein
VTIRELIACPLQRCYRMTPKEWKAALKRERGRAKNEGYALYGISATRYSTNAAASSRPAVGQQPQWSEGRTL